MDPYYPARDDRRKDSASRGPVRMTEMVGASQACIEPDVVRVSGEPAPDPQLDAVCRTAAALFGARYAFVSQVDDAHQWFLGREGLHLSGTPRSVAFCAHTVLGGAPRALRRPRHPPGSALCRQSPGHGRAVPALLRRRADHPGRRRRRRHRLHRRPEPRSAFDAALRQRLADLALFVEATLRGRAAVERADRAQRRVEASDSLLRATLESMDQGWS